MSALFDRPRDARALCALAHGAGAGMRHGFMEAVSARLVAAGIATFRYQFPYMEQEPPRTRSARRAHGDRARGGRRRREGRAGAAAVRGRQVARRPHDLDRGIAAPARGRARSRVLRLPAPRAGQARTRARRAPARRGSADAVPPGHARPARGSRRAAARAATSSAIARSCTWSTAAIIRSTC